MTTPIAPIPSNSTVTAQSRPLKWWEVQQLERQGCTADDWSLVSIHPLTDLSLIRDVSFGGRCHVGLLDRTTYPGCGLRRLTATGCAFGNGVSVRNVGGGLKNCLVGDRAHIENVARIEFEPGASCGVGTHVNVLDETGSRPVVIYPGLSAQSAALMARMPRLAEDELIPQTEAYIDARPLEAAIGEDAVVRDCGPLLNVHVGRGVTVEGARRLVNGAIINNAESARPFAYVGSGVDAEDFIIEDGRADSGALLRNCYVGQGAQIEKGFTAHDSLFFANCSLENGEACALFAGPYTVSMHKGTLLIGCQTSFMNAGSSTNQSNHMYKLGPVHWGVLERGVKTSSNSYLMLGALIGAFSLLMGQHKTHPDSSEFPFSYLFGDPSGATIVVPAMMLRSCGMLRDEKKWPSRDRRLKRRLPLHDRVTFEVLNPYTISRVLTALTTIGELITRPADDDRYIRYKGMKISRASLERARNLYTLAIYKYLDTRLTEGKELPALSEEEKKRHSAIWTDLAGQLITPATLKAATEAESVEQREELLSRAFENYPCAELEWIAAAMPEHYLADREEIRRKAAEFDAIVEEDRNSYLDNLHAEQQMLKLF